MANNRTIKAQRFLDAVAKHEFCIKHAMTSNGDSGICFLQECIKFDKPYKLWLQYGIWINSYGEYKCYIIQDGYSGPSQDIGFDKLIANCKETGKIAALRNMSTGFAIVTDNLDEFESIISAFDFNKTTSDTIDRFIYGDGALIVSNGKDINVQLFDMIFDITSNSSLSSRQPKTRFGLSIKNKSSMAPLYSLTKNYTVYPDDAYNLHKRATFINTRTTDILNIFDWNAETINHIIDMYKTMVNKTLDTIKDIRNGSINYTVF